MWFKLANAFARISNSFNFQAETSFSYLFFELKHLFLLFLN
ncbi:hypothetical protein RchiOBHm_Chr4g0406371 [Rosa chinensis]|uniref:Uncharacterized protein n=1 Tax=Rosa chinensis TaxID=74649 RepID=A0A2P6QUF3_ROSCH|nr:hypothetical protein RchiOBHm_Chr4g0406371 [Rosa chinensis]